MDLETVRITLTKDPEKAQKYELYEFYTRSIERFRNEEGTFQRL